ncbi:MAG: imidazoleglycerol-phosphate dehydratase HisB [Bacillota bacterium]
MRQATLNRVTAETDISLSLNLDAQGGNVNSGVGFFDHMLALFSKHSQFFLALTAKGDLDVDAHHTVEDVGIALGQALDCALGDRSGIARYGSMLLPMDEALVEVALDLSGRPYFVFDGDVQSVLLGEYDAQLTEEFFRALATNARMTLHIRILSGRNAHHIAEAIYKGVARALRAAAALDPTTQGIPSTKGVL